MKRTKARETKADKLRASRSRTAHAGGKLCSLGPLLCGACAKNAEARRHLESKGGIADELREHGFAGSLVGSLLAGAVGAAFTLGALPSSGRTELPGSFKVPDAARFALTFADGRVLVTARELRWVLALDPGRAPSGTIGGPLGRSIMVESIG